MINGTHHSLYIFIEFDVIFKKSNILKRLFGADQNNGDDTIFLDVDIKNIVVYLREFTNNTEGRSVCQKMIF